MAGDSSKSNGLFRSLLLGPLGQQAELQQVRLDEISVVVVGWVRSAAARQRIIKPVRHGRAGSGAGLAFGSLQARFSIERAHGGSLRAGSDL